MDPYARTTIEYRGGGAAILPSIVDSVGEESDQRRRRLVAEQALDQVLADSFPASDPPSWNPGIALLNPVVGVEPQAERSKRIANMSALTSTPEIIDVTRRSGAVRTFLHGIVSLAGAIGIALLIPLAILLVGVPIALAVRGALELFSWFFGVNVH
jgi:hypothetical protein